MDEMTCINTKHLAEKVRRAFEVCRNSRDTCSICPYKDSFPCTAAIIEDVNAVINGYQEQLDYVVSVNEKNVSEICKAKMEIEYRVDEAKALEEDIRALKENNARLAEQNKKLLEKEIENTKLRNENQTIREDNKYLDERNDKLCDELRHRDSKIRDLLEEIDRQNKELYHRREWEQLVRSQPTMILQTEPVKIEPIDYAKMAKAADKATKACEKLTKALDELDKATTIHIDLPVFKPNRVRAAFGMSPLNPNPHEIAKEGDIIEITTDAGRTKYFEVMFADTDGIRDRCGVIHTRLITRIYRKDENGNLKLIWEGKR